MKSVFSTILTTLCLFLAGVLSYAQNTISVTGTVKDGSGAPVIGASVMQKGATVGAATDLDGKYNVSVPSDAILEFSCIGMTTQEVNVNGRTVINVVLADDSNFLESVVVVGYGTQKRGSLTGAVAGINSGELMKTKTENPQNMLTGRVPGVRVWQTSAEPGTYSANMDIRGLGSPLVVIDGVPRTVSDFQRLTPEDIENVSVLKDASAAIYGVRGANGVILVSTKQGQAGKSKVSYNGSYTIQTPSKMPELMNAFDAMTIYNEKSMNSMTGGNIVYGEDAFEAFRNGTRRETDWNSLIIAKTAPQTQHDISISGGRYSSVAPSLMAKNLKDSDHLFEDYINHETETVRSKLFSGNAINGHILGILATGDARTEDDIVDFIRSTFYGATSQLFGVESVVTDAVDFLAKEQMVRRNGDEIEVLPFGKRVSDLYIDPSSASILREAVMKIDDDTETLPILIAAAMTPDVMGMYPKKADQDMLKSIVVKFDS